VAADETDGTGALGPFLLIVPTMVAVCGSYTSAEVVELMIT
jgi:hypothetical protein